MTQPSEALTTFTILFVDDNIAAIQDQIGEIEDYVKKEGFELEPLYDETGELFLDILDKTNVDIVATDMHISDDMDGVKVVKSIKATKKWTDILFYSVGGFDSGDIEEQVSDYRFIDFVPSKDIAGPLKRMIKKNIKRLKDAVYLRGVIISKMIDMELLVNDIIASYFKVPNENLRKFHDFVLENRGNTFEGKKETLAKIVKDLGIGTPFNNLASDIQDLQKNRNYVAHCRTHPDKTDCLISMGKPKQFTRAKMIELFKEIQRVSKILEELKERILKKNNGQSDHQ